MNPNARYTLALLAAKPLAHAVHQYGGIVRSHYHADELTPHVRGGYITARSMSNYYDIEYDMSVYWLGRLTTDGLAESIKSDATYYRITEVGIAALFLSAKIQ